MRVVWTVVALLGLGCAVVESTDDEHDMGRPDAGPDEEEAADPGTRPDGLRLDVPLPDGYTIEVSETADVCIPNACGGCGRLRADPGTPCGGCEGVYECRGPENVICVGGCNPVGCADNSREAFLSLDDYPEIAACGGGFDVPGILHAEPACDRRAGNESTNPSGTGCSIADLCADGWHPCSAPAEVRDRTGEGMPGDFPASSFFAAAVSGPNDGDECGIGTNDFYGLGTAGGSADRGTCAPLDRSSGDKCDDVPPPWDCGEATGIWQYDEATKATKPGPAGGGVLCCLGPGG